MSITTITTTASYQDVSADNPELHNCSVHALRPKISEQLKGQKFKRSTGWLMISCPECVKENPDRLFFGYGIGDAGKLWNQANPTITGSLQSLLAERGMLIKETSSLGREIKELYADRTRIENTIQSKSDLAGTKLDRIQQIAEYIYQFENPEKAVNELTQDIFKDQPAEVDWAGVDFDGLLSFGKAINPRYTHASERWHGFERVGAPVPYSGYKPLTSIKKEL